jgi:hypothetical protein
VVIAVTITMKGAGSHRGISLTTTLPVMEINTISTIINSIKIFTLRRKNMRRMMDGMVTIEVEEL